MKSKLNIIEFRNRFKESSKIGYPKFKLSPFGVFAGGLSSKTFYGIFDDSTFRLTINSTISPTFFILKGKYKTVNNTLNVNYTVEPSSRLQAIWVKFFPFISLFGVNLFFLLIPKKPPIGTYIAFNAFLFFIIFFSRRDRKRKKKNLEQKFIEVFEITE